MSNLLPPYVTTYSTRTPYVTAAEFMNTPTGVDVENLIPEGSVLTNTQTLNNILLRASGWADSLCDQVLCPTVDTKTGRFMLKRNNTLEIPLPYWPVVNVTGIQAGWTPSTLSTSIIDWANAWAGQDGILIAPLQGAANTVVPSPPYYYSKFYGPDMFAVVTYVNGWANTGLTSAVAAGASSLPVANALGIAPGQQLAVYSQTAGEVVTVASPWTAPNSAAPATVPIVGTLQNAYAKDDVVTAMPQEIKQAVIQLAICLIKTRGAEAFVLESIDSTPHDTDSKDAAALSEFDLAEDLLNRYHRIGF